MAASWTLGGAADPETEAPLGRMQTVLEPGRWETTAATVGTDRPERAGPAAPGD